MMRKSHETTQDEVFPFQEVVPPYCRSYSPFQCESSAYAWWYSALMPCYSPITGWRSRYVNSSGKRSIVFSAKDGYTDLPVTVPCGQCLGCRLEYSRQWAMRCVHEAQLHEENCFITLTFNPEHLPYDHSLDKRHLQTFFKRLRKALGVKVRYFACGEYGKKRGRPHYHAIIFGYDFPDKVLHQVTPSGDRLYRSALLERVWPFGFCTIGAVTFESAAYVARYVMKKHKGKDEEREKRMYTVVDGETGEVFQVLPEFCLMSRRPGIGCDWVQKFHSDTDKDFVTIRGAKSSLPRYYDNILAREDEESMLKRKDNRRHKAFQHREDNTAERLHVREVVKRASLTQLKRTFEDD